ncbi:hypothetical protein [Aeromicrobium ginsengisoli]|uniref:Sortase n=1 Tax=Aeromicrobium ginsengisoli TaxID=363867 RepID=A0A5M4FJS8_9ACTN|nr:hypothetical protein [Aeromicrobium ginsengisoli]KAA1400416.1 hypothetical protein ESP70_006760 [Aeromicrobium ginsengisoli]
MKRILAALVVAATAVLAVTLLSSGSDAPTPSSGPTALQSATLDQVVRPAKPPKAKFVRTIFATSSLKRSEFMLDLCKGPIAVFVGDYRPRLIAEHDYCGGLAWIPKLGKGDAIKLSGDGVRDGTYVVKTIGHAPRNETKVRDLPHTDIVLQTCVSQNTMVLVGMDLFEPVTVTS